MGYLPCKGFGLVSVLIALAIGAVLALAIQRLIVHGLRGQRQIAQLDELTTIRETIRKGLSCKKTLGDPASLPVPCAGPYLLRRDDNSQMTENDGRIGSWKLEVKCKSNELIIAGKQLPSGFEYDDIYHGTSDFCRPLFVLTPASGCDISKGEVLTSVDFEARTFRCSKIPNIKCVRQASGWINPLVNFRTYKVTCPTNYHGVSCTFDYYDNNGIVYHGFSQGGWNADRTECAATLNDGGISQGQVVAECCSLP